ncbi:hypothetical protein GQ457_05G004560 [Hibiscus cannabinus]
MGDAFLMVGQRMPDLTAFSLSGSMELENDQMGTCLFLLKTPLSWIVVVAGPVVTFASLFIIGSLSIFFTSTVLIFSTVLFLLSKRKPKLAVESVEEEHVHESVHESSPQMEDVSASRQHPGTEVSKQNSEEESGSPDVLSENECVDYLLSTTEGSDNMDGTPDWSDDGSISDEDSLIEISLPSGHYVKHKEDQSNDKYCSSMQQKFPDLMPESIFRQRSFMELLAEFNDMNEEENLIEIDISMGSIKCSRFEIEA